MLLQTGPSIATLPWSLEPAIVAPLAIAGILYARGVAVLWRDGKRRGVQPRHVAAFVVGWLVLFLAVASPLHELSEQLFSAHMIQHELLMIVSAPLLILGRPIVVMLWAFPRGSRRAIGRIATNRVVRPAWTALTRPFDAWLIHGVAIWIWHLPSLFGAALRSDTVHAAQHASFVVSALLFWWIVIHPVRRAERGVAILYLFTTAVHTGVLGALMTFARASWYPMYASRTAEWGLTPLGDQQLAGMIMWIPASAAYLAAALLIVRRWLHDSEWSVAQNSDDVYALPT